MRRHANLLALAGYVAVSFGYFGVRLVQHPGRFILGSGNDPQIFVWAFAWWPHAIGAGLNPFVSHAIYAPDGIDLAWATTVPGLAIPLAPVTVLFGPVVAFNVAELLLPALAAWTAYLLCRQLTRALWPSLVGGYLFGFSAYVLGQELGHPHMVAVFPLPLVALTVVRFVREELAPRGAAWRLGLLVALQLWISTELAFTLTLALAVSVTLAAVLVPDARPRLRALLLPAAAGYGLAGLLAAPLLAYAVIGFRSGSINSPPATFDADLANVVLPTHILALTSAGITRISSRFSASDAEAGAYLGLPALAAVVWLGIRRRRSAGVRFLLAALVLAVLASLGTAVRIDGRTRFHLPWHGLFSLPLFDNVLPVRIAAYTALAAAVGVALCAASSRGLLRYALPLLAVAVLVPAVWRPDYRVLPERWPFFAQGLYKLCIPKNENVLVFPYGFRGDAMLWQAESGFWFRMAEGYLTPKPPKPFIDDPFVQKLTYTYENVGYREIRGFARRKDVGRVISTEIYQHPSSNVMKLFGPLQVYGGMMVSPACGYPPLEPQPKG